MASAPMGEEKSLATHITELYELVLAYARQETVDPVRNLGRFIGFGLAGAVTFGIGATIMLLGALRALQTTTGTALQGNWSWAPYVLVAAGCGVIIGVAMLVRSRRPRGGGAQA
jgi:hypothetical protein